jgi:hypothetical protein
MEEIWNTVINSGITWLIIAIVIFVVGVLCGGGPYFPDKHECPW